jgi:hypothetical protein
MVNNMINKDGVIMTFFREIASKNLTQELMANLEQENATFVWKEDSVEIWVPTQEMARFTGRS